MVTGTAISLLLMLYSYRIVQPYARYVLDPEHGAAVEEKKVAVGIVLGAGITKEGKPFRELQSRLDTAADALAKGYVDKLVLSGDNRFPDYNEPAAMKKYLMQVRRVPEAKLHEDFAGRSTYETCERAVKVFQLERTILFSAESHLPRAIYLCRHFGIDAYGIASQVEANNQLRREALARVKAFLNVYVGGEDTVLGEPVEL